jgi:hypothetical protein
MINKIILLILCFSLLSFKAFAQESPQFSLGIQPSVIEIQANPPAQVSTQFSIENKSDRGIDLNIVVKPFKFTRSGEGDIEYLPANTFVGGDPSIYEKIKINDQGVEAKRITLKPFETRVLDLGISIDELSPASDYYFSILFISEPSDRGSSSVSAGAIGTNVILSVGGKPEPSAFIDEFSNPLIVFGNSVPFTLSINNTGERFIIPEGKVEIKDMFGRIAGEINILPQYILSHSSRYLVDVSNQPQDKKNYERVLNWKGKFLFGAYHAKALIRIDESGKTIEDSSTFIAIPIYIIFALSFFSFISLSIYIRVRKRLKK